MPTVYGPEYAGKEGTGLSRERKGVSVCMLRSTRPRIRGSGEGTVMVSGNFLGLCTFSTPHEGIVQEGKTVAHGKERVIVEFW